MTVQTPEQIFIPGGLPRVTYVPREHLKIEERVQFWKKGPHTTLMAVSGPTKTGKTVLLKTFFPDAIWLSGGAIETVDEFWETICDLREEFTDRELSVDADAGSSANGGIGASGGVVNVTGDYGTSHNSHRGYSLGRSSSAKDAARKSLRQGLPTVIIDDFHYINPDVQKKIIRGLKDLIFESLPVILISVPHRANDAIRVEHEMTGRLTEVSMGEWSEADLEEIGRKGFRALEIDIPGSVINMLSRESLGSPHLMQSHCLNISQVSHNIPLANDMEYWKKFFVEQVSRDSKTAFDLLKQGPRQRTDRLQRQLRNGVKTDIYGAILAAIASTGPRIELQYEDLRAALRTTLNGDLPQRHEVTNVLEQMTRIARDSIHGEPVLEYDNQYSTLYIADPFFAYFLKWAPESLKSLAVRDRLPSIE